MRAEPTTAELVIRVKKAYEIYCTKRHTAKMLGIGPNRVSEILRGEYDFLLKKKGRCITRAKKR